ncbi:hypothetical protein [Arthrobacter sp. B2I5]|nr:hypothetical protein [Arthrobacter sp. B2I5]
MADRTTTRPSGNLGSAIVNALLLYGINIWPGCAGAAVPDSGHGPGR